MPEHSSYPPAASLDEVLALAARLERDPRFQVREVFAFPVPFVEVKDIANGLVVTFSSQAAYVLYLDVILHDPTGGTCYA